MGARQTDEGDPREASAPGTSALEWCIAAIGALAVIGACSYLTYDALLAPRRELHFELRSERARSAARDHAIAVTLENRSDVSVADVSVVGELTRAGRSIESRRLVFAFAPEDSEVEGVLIFEADPESAEIELRVESYVEP